MGQQKSWFFSDYFPASDISFRMQDIFLLLKKSKSQM